jgi:uncharacterized protein YkwD
MVFTDVAHFSRGSMPARPFNPAPVFGPPMLVLLLLGSCGGGFVDAQKPSCPAARSAAESLALLNAARAVPRLCGATAFAAAAPLTWDLQLESAALAHSIDMSARNFFAHTNPDGVTASQRTAAAGYGPFTGENIGAGYETIESAMQGWLSSPGHCENIMRAAYRHYAVACSSGKGSEYGTYWTQTFGSK